LILLGFFHFYASSTREGHVLTRTSF